MCSCSWQWNTDSSMLEDSYIKLMHWNITWFPYFFPWNTPEVPVTHHIQCPTKHTWIDIIQFFFRDHNNTTFELNSFDSSKTIYGLYKQSTFMLLLVTIANSFNNVCISWIVFMDFVIIMLMWFETPFKFNFTFQPSVSFIMSWCVNFVGEMTSCC